MLLQQQHLGVVGATTSTSAGRSVGCRPRRSTRSRAAAGSRRRSRRPLPGCWWSCRHGRRSAPARPADARRAAAPRCGSPRNAAGPRRTAATPARTPPGASDRSGRGSSRARRAGCGGRRRASPARTRRPARDDVPWLTCGSCCGSPSSIRLRAARATAMVLARQNWPASSITNRSRLRASTRVSLAKSHAVPPITQPAWVGDERGVVVFVDRPATRRPCGESFLAIRAGSTSASIRSRNRFSTTACDCATTPTRQLWSLTSRAMILAAV